MLLLPFLYWWVCIWILGIVKLHIYFYNRVNAYLSISNHKISHAHTISDSNIVASNISVSDRQCFRARLPSNRIESDALVDFPSISHLRSCNRPAGKRGVRRSDRDKKIGKHKSLLANRSFARWCIISASSSAFCKLGAHIFADCIFGRYDISYSRCNVHIITLND